MLRFLEEDTVGIFIARQQHPALAGLVGAHPRCRRAADRHVDFASCV